jgi:mono/diheme cytochrome c family protein
MPSFNFRNLTDGDVAALIAFLRSAPVVETELPAPSLNLATRWRIVRGTERHMGDYVAAVPRISAEPSPDSPLATGEYLAMTSCNECHGLDLRGSRGPGFATPDLAIVAAYTWEQFQRLLNEGTALDGREDLGLMTDVALSRFAYFTEEEQRNLHAFLQTLASKPVRPDVFWRVD